MDMLSVHLAEITLLVFSVAPAKAQGSQKGLCMFGQNFVQGRGTRLMGSDSAQWGRDKFMERSRI